MTLEQAIENARLEIFARYGPKAQPDLNNRRDADQYDVKMQDVFRRMENAEQDVRRNWKRKSKETA